MGELIFIPNNVELLIHAQKVFYYFFSNLMRKIIYFRRKRKAGINKKI